MSTPLSQRHCLPCEGGMAPLDHTGVCLLFPKISGWETRDDHYLEKEFVFKNFAEALKFINQVAVIAESEGHHPDIYLYSYKRVRLTLSTHSIGGLSENDFILAAKIDGIKY